MLNVEDLFHLNFILVAGGVPEGEGDGGLVRGGAAQVNIGYSNRYWIVSDSFVQSIICNAGCLKKIK